MLFRLFEKMTFSQENFNFQNEMYIKKNSILQKKNNSLNICYLLFFVRLTRKTSKTFAFEAISFTERLAVYPDRSVKRGHFAPMASKVGFSRAAKRSPTRRRSGPFCPDLPCRPERCVVLYCPIVCETSSSI